jgi:hypothetical protein
VRALGSKRQGYGSADIAGCTGNQRRLAPRVSYSRWSSVWAGAEMDRTGTTVPRLTWLDALPIPPCPQSYS